MNWWCLNLFKILKIKSKLISLYFKNQNSWSWTLNSLFYLGWYFSLNHQYWEKIDITCRIFLEMQYTIVQFGALNIKNMVEIQLPFFIFPFHHPLVKILTMDNHQSLKIRILSAHHVHHQSRMWQSFQLTFSNHQSLMTSIQCDHHLIYWSWMTWEGQGKCNWPCYAIHHFASNNVTNTSQFSNILESWKCLRIVLTWCEYKST